MIGGMKKVGKKKPAGRSKAKPKAKPAAGRKAGSKSKRESKAGGKRPKAARRVDFKKLPLRRAIAKIGDHLSSAGYHPVLIGSACAAIYAGPTVKPKSLDFVIGEYQIDELDRTMGELGFGRISMNSYDSASSPYDVVFAPPPLAVGDDVVRETCEVKARPGIITLLNPTDCVRQRLSMFYRWGDREAFREAVLVAVRHDIDIELVRRWSEWEWCSDKFAEFLSAVEGKA